MKIAGEKIYLREGFLDKGLSVLLKWFNDIEIVRYFNFAKKALNIKNIEELKSFCSQLKDAKYFTIYTNNSDKFIGYIVFEDFKNQDCEVSITIGEKDYWKKGIGYESLRLMIDYAFKEYKLRKIHLTTSEYNTYAIRLYNKLGFKVTKKKQKDRIIYHNNKWINSATIFMELKK